ncbi:MAG: hypothetical protein QOD39_2740 [Mycobacterium sp.]|nr:hypothetical protein [Mycobacterium sp.]
MSGTHRRKTDRNIGHHAKKVALIGGATMTAAALTAGLVPLPTPQMLNPDLKLAAAVKVFPEPDKIPDLTGGMGTAGYDFAQSIATAILKAIMNNINLMSLARAAGMDPESFLKSLPPNVLLGVLDAVPLNLAPLLGNLLGLDKANDILLPALQLLGITDGSGITTVNKLLGLLGIDLSDPLNLSNLDVPGLNLITTGGPFTLLKLLGIDLGWVPALPNSVAEEVNNTKYLPIGVNGLLTTVLDKLKLLDPNSLPLGLGGILGDGGLPLVGGLDGLIGLLDNVIKTIPANLDIVDLRVPIVVGFGMGAFAAGAAYPKIVQDLQYQPGGAKSRTAGDDPLLGSITILPMLLLRNPGRANGGLFARAYPFARLFGIDTVTPDTEVTSSGGIPLLGTGLSLGGANLIPIKIDATVEYDLLSDFAAWPNPFSIANNLMGFLLPTYILRGVDMSRLTPQLSTQLTDILGKIGTDPLALNLYLTMPANSLPLLEPLYLLTDLTNLLTLGAFPNPLGTLANALSPALTSLVNLGYTDVKRMPDGTYVRTLDQAGDPTAFFSFPDVNWAQVPGDIVNLLVKGFTKEFFSGNPTPGTPNALTGVFKLLSSILGGGGFGGFGGIADLLNAVVGGLNPFGGFSPLAANAIPDANAKTVAVSTGPAPQAGNNDGGNAPLLVETGGAPAEDEDEAETPTTTKPSSSSSTVKPAGPSASPKPNPVGSVVGGVTSTVGGVTGGVSGVVGGVTGGVAGTVGGVTGGVSGVVGGVTKGLGGLTGGLGLGPKKPSSTTGAGGTGGSKAAA